MSQADLFVKRIDELLATDIRTNQHAAMNEVHTGALTLAMAIYGPGRPEVQKLTDAVKHANSQKHGIPSHNFHQIVWPVVEGALRAMRADVQSGVLGSIERRGAGATLADMLGLARDALTDGGPGTTNVAAVLAAASFEDTIRKMGESLAGVQGKPKLQAVLEELKNANVLRGASVATAGGFLKFRNDALHADWANLKPDVVASCISFVEQLLWQHFA